MLDPPGIVLRAGDDTIDPIMIGSLSNRSQPTVDREPCRSNLGRRSIRLRLHGIRVPSGLRGLVAKNWISTALFAANLGERRVQP